MATAEQIPGELNLELIQGDDMNVQLSVDENLSGYTIIGTIHVLHGGQSTVQTVLSAGSDVSTVQVVFPATTTAALNVTGVEGAHNWRLVWTDTAGLTRTFVKGSLTVLTPI